MTLSTPCRQEVQLPADIIGEIYAFDPIGKSQLLAYKRRAKVQASILGEAEVGESEAYEWLVSEPGHQLFGQIIDSTLMDNGATGVCFNSKGVAIIDGDEVFCEKVAMKDMDDWKKTRGLEVADVRLLGDFKDSTGKRNLELTKAIGLMKDEVVEDFPIAGTRAAKEYHDSIAMGPGNFLSYHSEWLRLSGVAKRSSAAHIHRTLMEALRLLHQVDQIQLPLENTSRDGPFKLRSQWRGTLVLPTMRASTWSVAPQSKEMEEQLHQSSQSGSPDVSKNELRSGSKRDSMRRRRDSRKARGRVEEMMTMTPMTRQRRGRRRRSQKAEGVARMEPPLRLS